MSETVSTPAPSESVPAGILDAGAPAQTPASAPDQFFGQHISKGGKFQEGWTESLRAKGFERLANKAQTAGDESTLFRILDETIAFTGKKTIPTYPGPDADDASLAAYRKSAGVPDTPEAYNIKPRELPPGVEWDDALQGSIAQIFHKHHVPEAAAKELIQAHVASLAEKSKAAGDSYAQHITTLVQQAEQTFRQEWGGDYEQRLEANKTFVQSRFKPEELSDPTLRAALSHPQIVRVIDEARRSLRESPLPGISAEHTGGSMSPRQQAQAIMKADPRWAKNPEAASKVKQLYELEAAQTRRQGRR
jgi:hypothetical protein